MDRNKLDITVNCRKHTMREEKFTFEYVLQNGNWFPLPTGLCDSCTDCETCKRCVDAVLTQARQEKPPFLE